MKKIFLIGALVASGFFCQNANAQSLLQNLLSGSSISNTSKQSTSDTKQNVGNLIWQSHLFGHWRPHHYSSQPDWRMELY